jgi:hypothetical protein
MLMKLMLEDGTEYSKVSEQSITEALNRLDGIDNTFIILLQSDDVFIQAARYEPGLYALEYRDERGAQFEAATLATQAQVTGAFSKYAQTDKSWLRDFNWRPMSD